MPASQERKMSQQEAIRLMDEEQLRRLDEFYQSDLDVHKLRQEQTEMAIKAAEEERTRRIQEELKANSQTAFMRRSSLKSAVDMMEAERSRRMLSNSLENLPEESKSIRKELQAAFINAVNNAPPSRRYSTINDDQIKAMGGSNLTKVTTAND
ncbi:hypothetical protein HDU67_002190 [Dinochytrium kinnereticum]|nr:hypothetical protein HDU67_002190 [Dinochytrium kinnereticum]